MKKEKKYKEKRWTLRAWGEPHMRGGCPPSSWRGKGEKKRKKERDGRCEYGANLVCVHVPVVDEVGAVGVERGLDGEAEALGLLVVAHVCVVHGRVEEGN